MFKIRDRPNDETFAKITLSDSEGKFWVRDRLEWCEVSDASYDNNIFDESQFWVIHRKIVDWSER